MRLRSAALISRSASRLDSSGNLYISEYGDSRIRKVTSGTGSKISTFAGNDVWVHRGRRHRNIG